MSGLTRVSGLTMLSGLTRLTGLAGLTMLSGLAGPTVMTFLVYILKIGKIYRSKIQRRYFQAFNLTCAKRIRPGRKNKR